jgi:hypothetical protein
VESHGIDPGEERVGVRRARCVTGRLRVSSRADAASSGWTP